MVMDVSVVIPAYNESLRIVGTLDALADFFEESGQSWELIVVDDGSSDDTPEKVGNWQRSREEEGRKSIVNLIKVPHQGKGAAVAEGIKAAQGRWILMTDADLSTPITEWPKLFEALKNGAVLVTGSRQAPGARVEKYQPLPRQMLGVLFGWMARVLFPVGVYDSQCGFKAFEAKAAKKLFNDLRAEGYCFDVEILLRARAWGFCVTEIPVRWRNDPDSRVRLWKDWPQVLRELRLIRRELKEGFREKARGEQKR